MICASIANKIHLEFFKWEFSILAFLLLIALLIGRGKHVKRALLFLLITLPLLVNVCLVHWEAVLFLKKETTEFTRILIAWVPTLSVLLTVLYSTLWGMWRGFRKSAIYLLHSVCAAGLCIGLYFFFIKSAKFDEWLLKIADSVTGGSLAAKLDVSAECATLRDVLAEWLPSKLDYGQEINLILRDNGAYLMTLVDAAYSIVFAFVACFLHEVLVFLLFIVYHIAYPERRYKKRKNKMFAENKVDRSYKKHAAGGGVIGFVRGLVASVLALSVTGSALYIVAGTGSGTMRGYSFEDEQFDLNYSIYRSIEDYGSSGIFKVLNAFKDTDDTPYYLFAVDLVFSGKLVDENNDINANIKLRKELSAYVSFARDTLGLLLKYGEDDIKPIISGQDTSGATDKIVNVMTDARFQAEFENLIDNFESQTYIINFALSAVNSIVCNLDDTRFASKLGEKNKEMLKVLFKPGYLTPVIPDDRIKLQNGVSSDYKLPSIGVSKIFEKEDVKLLYRMVASILSSDEEQSSIELVDSLLPQISELTMLHPERKAEFNPVLGRLYCFLANAYLSDEEGDGVKYSDVLNANVSWVDEINSLVTVASDGIELYQTVQASKEDGEMNKVLSLFDETAENYEQNMAKYDGVSAAISNSKLIGTVLATDYVGDKLGGVFASVSENIYIPENIVYENTFGANGTEYGELHKILNGFRLLGSKENRELLEKATGDEEMQFADMLNLLSQAANSADKNGVTLSNYMTDSVLMRSLISSVMLENAGETLYIPSSVLERDKKNEPVNIIEKNTLSQLFESLTKEEVKNAIVDFVDGKTEAGELLKNDAVLDMLMLKNGILEGTVSQVLLKELEGNEFVIIPRALENVDAWLTDKNVNGELYNLARAVRESGLDFEKFLKGQESEESEDELLDELLAMKPEAMDSLFASDVLYYTVSEHVRTNDLTVGDGFELIIPNSVTELLQNDVLDLLIKRKELKAIFVQASTLQLSSESSSDDILRQLVRNKSVVSESSVISASMAYFLSNPDRAEKNTLELPEKFKNAGQKTALTENRNQEVEMWQCELIALVSAMDTVFGISADENDEFTLNSETLNEKLELLIPDLSKVENHDTGATKLDVCCDSAIMLLNITRHLDKNLFDKWGSAVIKDEYRNNAKNADGCYPKSELKALIDSMTVFGLTDETGNKTGNIMHIHGATLRENAENSLTSMNEKRDDLGGKSGLDAVYPSVIISSMVTEELDKAFTASIINSSVRDAMKNEKGIYTKAELSACIDALNVLALSEGQKPSELLKNVSFADLKNIAGTPEKLSTLYRSGLVAGSITKSIQNAVSSNSMLSDHVKAYEKRNGGNLKEFSVYREIEVQTLMNLLGEDKEVGAFELESASAIKANLADENGRIKSYLLAASLTENLIGKESLAVPESVVGFADGIIAPNELNALLDAFTALYGDEPLGSWNAEFERVPTPEQYEKVLGSVVIRATLTRTVCTENSGELLVSASSVNIENRVIKDSVLGSLALSPTERVSVVAKEQLQAVLDVLNVFGKDGSFALPRVTSQTVNELSGMSDGDLNIYLKCDVLRFRVSGVIKDMVAYNPTWNEWWRDSVRFEQVVNIANQSREPSKEVLSAEKIKEFIRYF